VSGARNLNTGGKAWEWFRNWLVRRFRGVSCTEWKRRSAVRTHQIGQLQRVREGRVRLIPAAAIDAYVSLLTIEAEAAGGGDAA
jgi:hypothetical protein